MLGVLLEEEAAEVKITALAPWFGSKRTLAPRIVEALGEHRCYWEPFCGSMAVLLSKPVAQMETVNDLHGDLVNLAKNLKHEEHSQKLYWRLRRTLASEQQHRESVDYLRRTDTPKQMDFERAYHYFVASWLSMNGMAGVATTSAHNFARRYTSNGGSPGTRFVGAVESLPDWHERLRAVIVLNGCGIELCERIEDKAGTAIYVDPPYFTKGAKYVHDFAGEHHERLAAALNRFKLTRVVVSYYEHPELDRLYPGWKRLRVTMTKGIANAGKREVGREDAPEVLLVRNGA